MGGSDGDPVANRSDGDGTYEVTDWEDRTPLDSAAIAVHGLLRRATGVALVFLAALLLAGQVLVIGFAIYRNPPLGVLTLLSLIPAAVIVGVIWYGDVTTREPWTVLAATFVLGILFAAFAAVVNTVVAPVLRGLVPVVGGVLVFFLVVGPVEETVKWLATRVYAFNTDSFDAVIDGAVYGAVAGLGFATIENAVYIARIAIEQGTITNVQPLHDALPTATARSFAGPGHVIWSAIAGYYLGLAKFNPEDQGPIVAKGLLVAAFAHGLYNTLVTYLPAAGVELEGFAFLGFIVVYDGIFAYYLYRKLSKYRHAYREVSRGGGASAPD